MSDVRVGSLSFWLGLDVDQVKLNDVVQSLGKLNFSSVLAGLGVAGLVDGLKEIMEIGGQLTEPMYQFGKETGLSSQKMQRWTEYAQSLGVKSDVVTSSLSGLQKKMAAMQFGDTSLLSGIYLLQQAGAKITQGDLNDPFSFLNKATEGLQKIKPELRTYVAGLLGLNEQVLLLKSFNGAESMPAPTEEQIKAIRNYTGAWTTVGIEMRQVVTDVAAQFAPSLEYLGNVLSTIFTRLHSDAKNLRPVMEGLVGTILLMTGPLGQIGFLLSIIALHIKDIQNAGGAVGKWIGSLQGVDQFKSQGGLGHKAGLFASQSSNKVTHVEQQNAITIIAHNIEDLEHKVATFFEKTIAKSFYQNSRNY